jgi:hypothetical protein
VAAGLVRVAKDRDVGEAGRGRVGPEVDVEDAQVDALVAYIKTLK